MRWVVESAQPFEIVEDPGFQHLMKTGRPECYIPNPQMVSRDILSVFTQVRHRLAKKLQVGQLMSMRYLKWMRRTYRHMMED